MLPHARPRSCCCPSKGMGRDVTAGSVAKTLRSETLLMEAGPPRKRATLERMTGFEPATSTLARWRSSQLSYIRAQPGKLTG